ncbi:MAG TPA: FTR1 family protein [Sphingomicrobium sp.]|nr:FTR1 family protein [Sphingomicrobium sp.]
MLRRFLLSLALVVALIPAPAPAAGTADVQTTWQLLDYLAVDYGGAVRDGKVVSASEYAEMREFSASARDKIAALPANPAKAALVAESKQFASLVETKASPADVAAAAHALGRHLLAAYPVPLGPKQAPDLDRGDRLFEQNCASCHGAGGDARTAMARQLDPPPIAFADRQRARQRSPFALYQVINQGLEGTAMQSFAQLPDADKWALAFRAGRFAYADAEIRQGKLIWNKDAAVRAAVPDLNALSALSESQLAGRIGANKAGLVIAYLRAHPDAVGAKGSSLSLARERLEQSLAAYRAGDQATAKSLALSAYLDGFEPVEAALSARNATLLARVEKDMAGLRSAIGAHAPPADVEQRIANLDALFGEVESALSPDKSSAVSTFVGAATILLREGLEALLIVVAMLAFLKKGGRAEMTRPVHYGWISALVGGVVTWWAATELITVSGATRELTEGFGSVLAALILLFVGIWMHGKAQADEWQRYIREKMGNAVAGGSASFLFLLAFIAVYREIFETILFYVALAAEGNVGALIAGALSGAVLLAGIAIAMLKFSQRLPISKFFAYSSALVAVLAVVLAGKGVAALQEAGLMGVTPVDVPRISMLGLFPTREVVFAQLATLAILFAGFAWNRRRSAARLAAA